MNSEEMKKELLSDLASHPVRKDDRNCLSFWFPKLLDAGLPVPKTEIVRLAPELREPIFRPFDNKPMGKEVEPFFVEMRAAAMKVGLPAFLRTGQTSNKHEWRDTCYLESLEQLESHVLALIEFSEMCDMIGLPWDVWVLREMLPTMPVMIADKYHGMPMNREYRFFVDGGKILCWHPYWPIEAVVRGLSSCTPLPKAIPKGSLLDDDFEGMDVDYSVLPKELEQQYKQLRTLSPYEYDNVADLAERAGVAIGGQWSVDILETTRGWYITDLAEAERSFHWPECERLKKTN